MVIHAHKDVNGLRNIRLLQPKRVHYVYFSNLCQGSHKKLHYPQGIFTERMLHERINK